MMGSSCSSSDCGCINEPDDVDLPYPLGDEESEEAIFDDNNDVLVQWLQSQSQPRRNWDEFRTLLSLHPDKVMGGLGFHKPTILHRLVSLHEEEEVPLDVLTQVLNMCPEAARLKAPFSLQDDLEKTVPIELVPGPSELPLHEACRTMAFGFVSMSFQHIELLVNAYPEALSVESKTGTPLAILCGYNMHMKMISPSRQAWTSPWLHNIHDAIRLLMKRYPAATLVKSGFTRRQLPIQYLQKGYQQGEYRYYVDGYRLHETILLDERTKQERNSVWPIYMELLRVTHGEIHKENKDAENHKCGCCMLCTAIYISPNWNDAIYQVLKQGDHVKSHDGTVTFSCRDCYKSESCHPLVRVLEQEPRVVSTRTIREMVITLIKQGINPCLIPETSSAGGRYPLCIAIEQGWDNAVLECLAQGAPEALNHLDPRTRLYPFLLAATTTTKRMDNATNAIYSLLRRDVSMLRDIVDEPWLRMHTRLKRTQKERDEHKSKSQRLEKENKRLRLEIENLKSKRA